MKKIKRIISVITVLGLLLSTPITAFARTLYEQVKYLDDKEIFDGMWSELVTSQGTENEEATGNTFILSYYHQDLQDFLSSYKIPDGDFKLINLRDAYFEKIENSDTAIEPYSKKVFNYIAAHPDFELSWSFDTSEKEYTCYDKSELIDSFYSDTFVEYSKTNVKNKSFWTYDESNDTYVNKTESGKVVKSIPKYHLEDSNSSSKQSSSGKTESNNEHSQNRNKSDVGESAVEIDEDSSRIVSGADNSNDNLSGSNSELEKATATVPLSTDDFAVLEAPQEEDSSNQADVAILISIGGLILAGIGVIIYLLIKKKKNKKSGDTNEKDKEDLQ